MIIVGIDPGLRGGICVIGDDGIYVNAMKLRDGDYWIDWVCALLSGADAIYIERAQAYPGQGVCSTFTTGRGYGLLYGLARQACQKVVEVPPRQWQKKILGTTGGESKKLSATYCQTRWPKERWTATGRSKKPHDGMTDAACIAAYGMIRETEHSATCCCNDCTPERGTE